MKNIKLVAIALIMVMFSSCEEKTFDVVLNLLFSHSYTVNGEGDNIEEYSITKEEIKDKIDVPDTASLDSVYITNLSVTIKTLAGNTANQVTVNGEAKYSGINNGSYFTVFNNNTFNLPAVGDSIEVDIENLVVSGVQDLKYIFNELVLNPNIPQNESLTVKAQSSSIPLGSNIHAEITLHLKGSAVFEYKTELVSIPEKDKSTQLAFLKEPS